MASRPALRSPQVAALLALGVALVAITQASSSIAVGPGTTYDASSSLAVFRNVTILAIVFYAVSFLTRWVAIPGILCAILGALAVSSYLLVGPGSESALALVIAVLGLVFAVWKGISILRRRGSPT